MRPTPAKIKPKPEVEAHVSSGFPSPAEDYEEPPLDLHDLVVENQAATFFMRSDTDVMHQAGIERADILVVDRSRKPENRRLLVAIIDGVFQVKRCIMCERRLVVADDHGSMQISPESVWGVVTYIVRKV